MENFDIPIWLILLLAVVAWYIIRSLGQISIAEAKRHLQQGAVLLDVRTSEEYEHDHIPGSVNLPLAWLPRGIGEAVKDKDTVILCHCLSGVRSGTAVSRLKRMGYTAYNVGSIGRAKKLATD